MKTYLSSKLVSGKSADNSPVVQAAIDKAKSKICLMFPDGEYYFSSPLTTGNKGLTFQGSENTTLWFRNGGIIVNGNKDTDETQIVDLDIKGDSKIGCGIEAHSVIQIINCLVYYFETGVKLLGDIGNANTNVSGSIIERTESVQCDNGFYMQGGDANAIGFYQCDARDCNEWGFHDAGFLGSGFFNCMTHHNGLGGFKASNDNNRSRFFGCYVEGDQPPNEVQGHALVMGGICGGNAQWKIVGGNPTIIPEELIYK